MRIQTKRECDEQNRRYRLAREEVRAVNTEKAGMAIELTTARQWLDRWRGRALNAEAANRRLHAENMKLLAKVAAMREDGCEHNRTDSGAARRRVSLVKTPGRAVGGGVREDAGGPVPPA